MLWSHRLQPGETAVAWLLRRRRWEALRWPLLHAAGALGSPAIGWWMFSTGDKDPRIPVLALALVGFGVMQVVKFCERLPALVALKRDPVVARIREWGDFDEIARDVVAQLGRPVGMAGNLTFTEDYVIDDTLDVRRIEDIRAISRLDTVYKSYGFIERETVRTTSLTFDDAQIPLPTGPGIGQVLTHLQRRAPWLADSLGVDPAKLRAPARTAAKPKPPQGPVVKNPPTRRPPPRAS